MGAASLPYRGAVQAPRARGTPKERSRQGWQGRARRAARVPAPFLTQDNMAALQF